MAPDVSGFLSAVLVWPDSANGWVVPHVWTAPAAQGENQ